MISREFVVYCKRMPAWYSAYSFSSCKICSQFKSITLVCVKRMMRYLNYTMDLSLQCNHSEGTAGYCNTDCARDIDDHQSTPVYILLFTGTVISWYSGKQTTVSTSTTLAAYVSLANTTKEVSFLKQLICWMFESHYGKDRWSQ